MAYRNYDFYMVMFSTKTTDEAYKFALEQLRAPSFRYEEENMKRAFLDTYKTEFSSPETREVDKMKEELARLREQVKAKPRFEAPPPSPGGVTTMSFEPKVIQPEPEPEPEEISSEPEPVEEIKKIKKTRRARK